MSLIVWRPARSSSSSRADAPASGRCAFYRGRRILQPGVLSQVLPSPPPNGSGGCGAGSPARAGASTGELAAPQSFGTVEGLELFGRHADRLRLYGQTLTHQIDMSAQVIKLV